MVLATQLLYCDIPSSTAEEYLKKKIIDFVNSCEAALFALCSGIRYESCVKWLKV